MAAPDSDLPSPTDLIEAQVRDYFERLYRPGTAQFHGIVHVAANPVSGVIAFSGPMMRASGGFPVTRIGLLAPGGAVTLLGSDDANDSQPKWSPDGRWLAFHGFEVGVHKRRLAPHARLFEIASSQYGSEGAFVSSFDPAWRPR